MPSSDQTPPIALDTETFQHSSSGFMSLIQSVVGQNPSTLTQARITPITPDLFQSVSRRSRRFVSEEYLRQLRQILVEPGVISRVHDELVIEYDPSVWRGTAEEYIRALQESHPAPSAAEVATSRVARLQAHRSTNADPLPLP